MAIYADDAGTLVIWTTAGRGGETEEVEEEVEREGAEKREKDQNWKKTLEHLA